VKHPLGALLAACLVVLGGVCLSPLDVQEAAPSLVAWTADIPMASLVLTSPARSEKPLHAERAGVKKPLRLARALPVWEQPAGAQPRPILRHPHALPRRFLPSGRTPSRSPDDPSH
jgi:hypothetical protein